MSEDTTEAVKKFRLIDELREAKTMGRDTFRELRDQVRDRAAASYLGHGVVSKVERSETVRETIIQPVEVDEGVRTRLEQAEDVLAWVSDYGHDPDPVDLSPILSRLDAAEATQLDHDRRITALEQSVEHLREFITSVADSVTARLDALEAKPEPELEVEPVEDAEPAEADPFEGIPQSLRQFVAVEDTPQKFTLRMRRRYQALKHMQMDATRPTNLRSFPDMTEEEVVELNMLEAMGHETVNWLGAQA